MDGVEFDEIVELFAKHIVNEIDKNDWLGNTLEKHGFDLANISDEDTHMILIRTILKLYDEYEEDIEAEEEEDEEEAEEEEFDDEDELEEDDDDDY